MLRIYSVKRWVETVAASYRISSCRPVASCEQLERLGSPAAISSEPFATD